MKLHFADQTCLSDKLAGRREDAAIELDGLDHRLSAAFTAEDDDGVSDVRPDFDEVLRILCAHQELHKLPDLGIRDRMVVLRRKRFHPRLPSWKASSCCATK